VRPRSGRAPIGQTRQGKLKERFLNLAATAAVLLVVFAVDEKPQIQALDRTAPTLPMLPTTPQRATHDYLRHGTIDLVAALDVARGHGHHRPPALAHH
jgi:hypothetical protein